MIFTIWSSSIYGAFLPPDGSSASPDITVVLVQIFSKVCGTYNLTPVPIGFLLLREDNYAGFPLTCEVRAQDICI